MQSSSDAAPAVVRTPEEVAAVRAQAIRHAHQLRALAFIALRDGMPKSDLRAANARAAARSVIRAARRVSEDAKAAVRARALEVVSDTADHLEPA